MSFSQKVVELIKKIPKGKVATYGQIAALANSPRAAISVGQILHRSSEKHDLPWQRVINRQGRISVSCLEHPAEMQVALLREDGVKVIEKNGSFWVNLGQYQWQK